MRTLFRIAGYIGCTINELMARVGPEELDWWLAFFAIEPIGAIHDERRNAELMQMMVAVSPYTKRLPSIDKLSGYLADNADIGTDEETADRMRIRRNESALRGLVSLPGVRKVKRQDDGSDSES